MMYFFHPKRYTNLKNFFNIRRRWISVFRSFYQGKLRLDVSKLLIYQSEGQDS